MLPLPSAALLFCMRRRGTEARRIIETRSILPTVELFPASWRALSQISLQFSKHSVVLPPLTHRNGWGGKSGTRFWAILRRSVLCRRRLRSYGPRRASFAHAVDIGLVWQRSWFKGLGGLAVSCIAAAKHLQWVGNDYGRSTVDQLTSTPHQPANACFAPSLLPNVAEYGPMQASKMRKIKGLARK